MEKDPIFGHPTALRWPEDSSWDFNGGGGAHFESALSSMVSSPSSSSAAAAAPAHGLAIRELIGRLGTICSSDADASCYSTPLHSPPTLAAADPGFAERAARLSGFGHAGGFLEPGKLSRVSSSRSMKLSADQESSVVSDPNSESSGRKRKAAPPPPKGKAKNAISSTAVKMEEDGDSSAKRSRSLEKTGEAEGEAAEPKPEPSRGGGQKRGKEKDKDAKPPETPKQDYIHVRARRGQATDRHSLAERVRREKISERMKLLQDLVPGCNKIIGKAMMLDEIINYVQSLQRQVEFLSMKLATLNPHLDLSMDTLLQKDIQMHQALNSVHLLEASAAGFVFPHQPQQGVIPLQFLAPTGVESQDSADQLGFTLPRTSSMQMSSLDGFGDAASHHGTFLENDLQSFVQMGFGQNQEPPLASHSFHGHLPTDH